MEFDIRWAQYTQSDKTVKRKNGVESPFVIDNLYKNADRDNYESPPPSHTLHTNVSCSKTGTVSNHSKACTSCGGNLGNIGGRVCKWQHQYCPVEYGVCQY